MLYGAFATQAEIDAEYNASMRMADPAAEMRHFVDRSQEARERLRCTLDVPFGPTRAESLDIFPADRDHAPVFVFLHGGYWRALSSKEFSSVALGLQPIGITTVVVNHALCPAVSLDEVVRQARAAVAWVLRRIGEHGGDAARVAVGGHSAGGHLTAMCLQAAWDTDYGLSTDPVKAAVLVSGVYDIEPLRWSYLQPQIQLDAGLVQRHSPAFHVRRSATPILITWGEEETAEFARQSQIFHAAWQAAGNTSTLEAQPATHHFSIVHGFEQPESRLCQWIARALSV
jgi:arylformamidase